MSELDFNLPDGITLNSVESEEAPSQEGIMIRKISCPDCQFLIKAVVYDNFGRFSGKIFVNENNEIWNGKLASDPAKSKSQILEVFNKKVKDHLDKCKTKV